jgi:hypothetical protein
VNKNFLIAILVAVLLVAGGVLLIARFQPSMQEQQDKAMEGAVREGSPEFAALTKKIIIETDKDNTIESPVGTGYIMMNLAGKIRNYNDKALTGLEVNVAVLDIADKVVKDSTMIVVPNQQKRLEPKGEMHVNIRIDGFDPSANRAKIRWKVTAIKYE